MFYFIYMLCLHTCVADMYLLSEGPESYHYLSQAGCVQDSSLDDKQLFNSVMVSCSLQFFIPPPGDAIYLAVK